MPSRFQCGRHLHDVRNHRLSNSLETVMKTICFRLSTDERTRLYMAYVSNFNNIVPDKTFLSSARHRYVHRERLQKLALGNRHGQRTHVPGQTRKTQAQTLHDLHLHGAGGTSCTTKFSFNRQGKGDAPASSRVARPRRAALRRRPIA